jgi:hypothetical protein
MISKAEFRRRVAENTEYFQRNYKKSLDISRYHFFDAVAGEQAPLSLMDKVHDIMTAVAVGALPLTTKSGADAMMLIDGELQEIELKFSTISSENFTVGPRGGIVCVRDNSKMPLSSVIMAKWTINTEDHLKSKNRPSILVAFDKSRNEFIDARMLSGKKTVELLSQEKKSKARFINWAGFERHGSKVKLVAPSLSYSGLCTIILHKALDKLTQRKNNNQLWTVRGNQEYHVDYEIRKIQEKISELV